MNNPKIPTSKPDYDPRWFIWTIVFLVVTGVSLVSYIMLSDTSAYEVAEIKPTAHRVQK